MIKPSIPIDEKERQESLDNSGLLDTPAEERFDRYTRLARRLFGVQIALVSLVDRSRQWFKSRQGLDATETAREISFCGHAINDKDRVLVVENAVEDKRFHDNPLVTGDPSIRFYAGYPITSDDGQPIGTLCIIDGSPREFTQDDVDSLCDIGQMVSGELAALRLATIDDLTGLSNRRAFTILTEQALAICHRNGKTASLLMIDLDGFKQINDELGHACGDSALVEFADTMRAVFRESDVLARRGGDEFCVLLTDTNADHAWDVVERFRETLEARNSAPGRQYQLRFSAGIVEVNREQRVSPDELLMEADRIMYERKRSKAGNYESMRQAAD